MFRLVALLLLARVILGTRGEGPSLFPNSPREDGVRWVSRAIGWGSRVGLALTASTWSTTVRAAPEPPVITDRVYLDCKIANYTEESVGTNRGATGSGRLVIGLYGKEAPQSVARFLEVLSGDGLTHPNYVNSQFTKINTESGLLEMEKVRRLNKVKLAGGDAFEYDGNLLPEYSAPILESNDLRHNRRGLLTRNKLTSTPEFGITMRDSSPNLDGFHCVFGEVLEASSFAVLDAIAAIPTYTYTTSSGYGGKEKTSQVDSLAESWFSAQREFYVGAGKAFGDGRAVDLRGKLLRRVTITRGGRV